MRSHHHILYYVIQHTLLTSCNLTIRAVRGSQHINDMASYSIIDNQSFVLAKSEADLSLCTLTDADVMEDVPGSVDGVLAVATKFRNCDPPLHPFASLSVKTSAFKGEPHAPRTSRHLAAPSTFIGIGTITMHGAALRSERQWSTYSATTCCLTANESPASDGVTSGTHHLCC